MAWANFPRWTEADSGGFALYATARTVTVGHAASAESMIPTLPPLADVLDLMPDAVCVVDVDGRFLFVNASFQRILG
jgi:PAS domain-containing protein